MWMGKNKIFLEKTEKIFPSTNIHTNITVPPGSGLQCRIPGESDVAIFFFRANSSSFIILMFPIQEFSESRKIAFRPRLKCAPSSWNYGPRRVLFGFASLPFEVAAIAPGIPSCVSLHWRLSPRFAIGLNFDNGFASTVSVCTRICHRLELSNSPQFRRVFRYPVTRFLPDKSPIFSPNFDSDLDLASPPNFDTDLASPPYVFLREFHRPNYRICRDSAWYSATRFSPPFAIVVAQ